MSAGHDIICIAASAGGVEALLTMAWGLPAILPASVFTLLQISPYARGVAPGMLRRAGAVPADHAADVTGSQP